jgi:ankyrin repeat protein
MRARRTSPWTTVVAIVAVGAGWGTEVTSLLELAANDQVGKLAQAIEAGMPVDGRDGQGRTSLHVAAETSHLFVAMLLIAKGADPNARDRHRRTPLHVAAAGERRTEGERFQIVKLLIAKGASRKALDADGKRPVDYATTKEFRDELRP